MTFQEILIFFNDLWLKQKYVLTDHQFNMNFYLNFRFWVAQE